jgi:hypothetical protein
VDAVVVFDEDTPERVLAELRPDIWVKGGDYAGAAVPEADLVRSWGGQAVVVPYLDGRSSTRLVHAARGKSDSVARGKSDSVARGKSDSVARGRSDSVARGATP